MSSVKKVDCGNMFTMALTEDGTLYGWGSNEEGQLGTGNRKTSDAVTVIERGVVDFACGSEFAMYITASGEFKTVGQVFWR